jgi:hypothetical protein
MTAMNPDGSQQAVVEAALVLLERMGLIPADLAVVPQDRLEVPTFAMQDSRASVTVGHRLVIGQAVTGWVYCSRRPGSQGRYGGVGFCPTRIPGAP